MKTLISSAVLALSFATSAPVLAQMNHDMHGGTMAGKAAPASADSSTAEALVKKVDKVRGTVTLAHGPMNGMPAMTMAYRVKDAAWLDSMQVGQKIRFATDPADGGMTVLRFEAVK
jgi:Cu/Ag efflux protein CusF